MQRCNRDAGGAGDAGDAGDGAGVQRCNQVKGAEVVQWWRGAVVLNLQTW